MIGKIRVISQEPMERRTSIRSLFRERFLRVLDLHKSVTSISQSCKQYSGSGGCVKQRVPGIV